MRGRRCQHCDVQIAFITSATNEKNIPVECEQEITVVTRAGNVVRGFKEHWSGCPGADEARQGKLL